MGLPQLGNGPAYEIPPEDIISLSPKLYDYLLMIHATLFGIPVSTGSLNDINVNQLSHSNLSSVTAFQHHGATGHDALLKAAASTDASASAVSVSNNQSSVNVTSADASNLATVITLANEIKGDVNTLVSNFNTAEAEIRGDVNQLVTDLNTIRSSLNDLKTKMRTANLLST